MTRPPRVTLPKVAFIGTGGTIASLGAGPLELQDYGATGKVMHADEILARFPETALVAEVIPVRYRNVPSTNIAFPDWQALVKLCDQLGPVVNYPGSACGFESVPSSLRLSGVLAVSPNCHSARSIDTGRRIAGSGAAPPSIHRRSASWRLTDAAVWTA